VGRLQSPVRDKTIFFYAASRARRRSSRNSLAFGAGLGVELGVGVSGNFFNILLSVLGPGARNIRIGRIASPVVSTNPIVISSQRGKSRVDVHGDICANSRNLGKRRVIGRTLYLKSRFVV